MKTYRTAALARSIGVHPNTVRLYEALGLIPQSTRMENGYRTFTDLHVAHMQLARLAFQIEVLQNGLRKKIVSMVKTAAAGDYDAAIVLTREYIAQVQSESRGAREAIESVRHLLSGAPCAENPSLRRSEAAEALQLSIDTLRNWEMNGLMTVRRRANGYRVYSPDDIRRLRIIRALRCANYSLEAILRLLTALDADPEADIAAALNTPAPGSDILSACDRLIVSLQGAERNARLLLVLLEEMKIRFS